MRTATLRAAGLALVLAACSSTKPAAGADAGTCSVGGQTFAAGDVNPNQPCQSCQPAVSTTAFSDFIGLPPDGGCAQPDQVCNAGTCQRGCVIADLGFVAAGALEAGNVCRVCQPSLSPSAWTVLTGPAPDGGCGAGELCNAGSCAAGCVIDGGFIPAGQSQAANACNLCDPTGPGGLVAFSPASSVISCGAGEHCSERDAGVCEQACVVNNAVYDPGEPNPSSQCQLCDPATSATSFSNEPDATTCSSGGNYCKAGACGSYCDIGGALVAAGSLDTLTPNPNQCCNLAGPSSTAWTPGFGSAITTPSTTATPVALAVGDVTGDGIPDIVVAETGVSNVVEIFAGHGDGTFATPTELSAPNPTALALADFNADGKLDIAVANNGANSVTILLNQGSTTFNATTISGIKKPTALIVADLQAPGSRDLVVGDETPTTTPLPEIRALTNQAGSFANAGSAVLSEPTSALAVGNFNGVTGEVDVAALGTHGPTIVAFTNAGATANAGTQDKVEPGGGLTAMASGVLLSGGTLTDLVVADPGAGSITPVLESSSGLAAQSALTTNAPAAVAIADLNGDGLPDVAGAAGNGTVQVFINQTAAGATSTSFFTTSPGSYPVGPGPVAMAVADLNGDGKPDIVTASGSNDNLSVLLGQCP